MINRIRPYICTEDTTFLKYENIRAEHCTLATAMLRYIFWPDNELFSKILNIFYYFIPGIMTCGLFGYVYKIICIDKLKFTEYISDLTFILIIFIGTCMAIFVKRSKTGGLVLINIITTSPFIRVKDEVIKRNYVPINRIVFVVFTGISLFWVIEIITSPLQAIYMDFLYFPFYYFVDLGTTLTIIFNVAFLMEIYFLFMIIWTIIAVYYTLAKYFESNCVMIVKALENLKLEKDLWKRQKRFSFIVQHHLLVCLFWKAVGDLIKYPILIIVTFGTGTFALMLISLYIEFQVVIFAVMIMAICIVLMGCFVFYRFEDISIRLHHATFYAMPWDGDIAIMKKILFLNLRMQYYFHVPIGDVTVLTNELILQLTQTIYSMITMYLNTNKSK
ncbi:uncharacterized protein [Atheta coriaria]|uniref:uncharacterized protein n=1 Tax=Dalotia coriaria TaxID=877792 RepID=UPI0031F3447A